MTQATRHIPLRTCRVCRAKQPKLELNRWVAADGGLVPDEKQSSPGRGYYSCSGECSQRVHKHVKLNAKARK